jgi:ferritin-like metal-binding protein YciE
VVTGVLQTGEEALLPAVDRAVLQAMVVAKTLRQREVQVAAKVLVRAVVDGNNTLKQKPIHFTKKIFEMRQKTNQNGNRNFSGRAKGNKNDGKRQESLLEKFFIDQLKDIYYAEQQLVKALPKMQEAATTEELEDAFENHLQQTERHVKRLEKVFKMIQQEPEGEKCEAMDGLIREAQSIIDETEEGTMTRDAALIIAAQKVEHYEIATYGGLVQLALTMGLHRAADILEKTLAEEEDTDQQLTFIAEGYINVEAENEGGYSWEKQEETEENVNA